MEVALSAVVVFGLLLNRPNKSDHIRVNDRAEFDDPAFSEQLWKSTALQDLVKNPERRDVTGSSDALKIWGGEVIGLNPRIRIYRYGN